jgi:hypothetical protein
VIIIFGTVMYAWIECEKTAFLRHFYLKTKILPRQARDKDRENSKKMPFLRSMAYVDALYFTVVTATTVGFGDCEPPCQLPPPRVVLGCLLLAAFAADAAPVSMQAH